ncbi:hypothetical protein GGR56DRAFT_392886 [Xylariaceae sp. FL0804]|nr:hypothetical protein GGR56DRAFT_392886 [Xylariaceae sp. FL0804]
MSESPAPAKTGTPKDRACQYCGQAFTSSSLGRHLDLYIKEKNPKAPDGIHDVDEIRKTRNGITRRQPRGSLARRNASSPATPAAAERLSPGPESSSHKAAAPAIPQEGQFVVDHQTSKFPFQPTWEATGVMNDLPARNGELKAASAWGEPASAPDASTPKPVAQRAPSRVAQRAQLDARQKLGDAMDTARAAELALRELLSSWRAAKQHIDMNSLPFDFEPLSLDFPALTLQCLQAPPTLFSSTPHPTSTSWSIQPPAQKQYEALQTYFREEFHKWRVACAMATTATSEDLTYPPSHAHLPQDVREGVKKAEKAAAALEKQVNEHLQSAFQAWEQQPAQRKSELWVLELARSVGRRQKDLEKLKESQHAIKQENANLKTQIEQLNRLQQPREFRIMPPATIPIEDPVLSYCLDFGAKGHQGVGLNTNDRHLDLSSLVSRAIERWKTVIVSSRGAGMAGQRSLDESSASTPIPTPIPTTATMPAPAPTPRSRTSTQHRPSINPVPTPNSVALTDIKPTVTRNQPTSVADLAEEGNSDQDADAEMDEDDSFAPLASMVGDPPSQRQQHSQLDVPRARGHSARVPTNADPPFVPNGTGGGRGLNVAQSMPNMNKVNAAALSVVGGGQIQHGHVTNDYGSAVPGVADGESMYMDSD